MATKGRVTALDVRAAVAELRPRLLGFRLQNIYDISASKRSFLLKFGRSEEKEHVVIEAGIRLHPTEWKLEHRMLPSHFVARLRKYLRSRRLDGLRQLGADRVVDFTFGTDAHTLHLIVEFYVSGNVLLADPDYKIISVLRTHSNVEEGRVAVGHTYVLPDFASTLCTIPPLVSGIAASEAEFVQAAFISLRNESHTGLENLSRRIASLADVKSLLHERLTALSESGRRITPAEAVAMIVPFAHPALVRHAVTSSTSLLNIQAPKWLSLPVADEPIALIIAAAVECIRILFACSSHDDYLCGLRHPGSAEGGVGTAVDRGYAIRASEPELKTADDPNDPVANSKTEIYSDFTPYLLTNHQKLAPERIRGFHSFLACLDAYFSRSEAHKQEVQESKQKLSKTEKIVSDQSRRYDALLQEAAECLENAVLIEKNLDFVQRAIDMVRQSLSVGVSWGELWRHIRIEKRSGHPIAVRIHSLDFENRRILLMLQSAYDVDNERDAAHEGESLDEESPEEAAGSTVAVYIDTTAYGNIERYHSERKSCFLKAEKTKEAMTKAVKKTAKKTGEKIPGLTKGIPKPTIMAHVRKRFWFEKFNWFITTENFLVLAGRDAQQNDILYRRYFDKHDIYVHADIHGAPSCLIKAPPGPQGTVKSEDAYNVPPQTLLEAGAMSVCRSRAWTDKLPASAWWVYRAQVSKTAPAGEYIVAGGFIIRGKKNYLPPVKLMMGLGLFFQIDEHAVPAHRDERNRRTTLDTLDHQTRQRVNQFAMEVPTAAQNEAVAAQLKEEDVKLRTEAAAREKKRKERLAGRKKNALLPEPSEPVSSNLPSEKKQDSTSSKSTDKPLNPQVLSNLPRGKRNKVKKILNKIKEDALWGDAEEEKHLVAANLEILGQRPMKEHEQLHKLARGQRTNFAKNSLKGIASASPTNNEDTDISDGETHMKPGEKYDQKVPNSGEDGSHNEAIVKSENSLEEHGEADVADFSAPDEEDLVDTEEAQNNSDHDADVFPEKPGMVSYELLDTLTAKPLPDDGILAAIPVCAPWDALKDFKYKVKLAPGNAKKGKVAQQILDIFSKKAAAGPDSMSEWEAIRATLSLDDLCHALVSDLKLVPEEPPAKQRRAAV